MQNVTHTYFPVDSTNTVNWYVDDYSAFGGFSYGMPITSFVGTGNVLTIMPFQYSTGYRVRAQEVDPMGSVLWETFENSVFHDPTPIPVYYHIYSCGRLEAAPPYDGSWYPQRWSMWYRDGIATGFTEANLYGPLPGGTYQYKLLLSCSADTLVSYPYSVGGFQLPEILASDSTTFCDGDSVVLTLQTSHSVLNWRKNGVAIPGSGGKSYITVFTAGDYSVQVYNQSGGGSSCYQISPSITVTVNPAAIISGLIEACIGDSVTLACTPANSYQWQRHGVNIPGATSQFLQVIQGGNYKVYTTGLTCNISDVHNLKYYAKPSGISMSHAGIISICKNEALSLTLTGNNINSWNWFRNNISMPGSNTPTITVTKPGNYKCVVSNAIGCSKTSQVAKLSNPVAADLPLKTITIKPGPAGSDSYTSCVFGNFGTNFGNAASLEVSAWYKHFRTAERGYLKFDLSSIPEESPIVSAQLRLYADTAVVYQNGLQTLFVNRITENWLENTITWDNDPDSSGFQSSSIPVTAGQSNTTVWVNITDIARHWSYNPAENYGVLLHLEENVSSTIKVGWMSFFSGDHATVASRPKLTIKYSYADITENGPLTFCAGGSVMFSTNPGYNYQWYENNNAITGANAADYTATTAGDYYVILSNAAGCSVKSATKTVTIPCREGKLNTDEIRIIHQQSSNEIKVILPLQEGVITIFDITGRQINSYDCHESECIVPDHRLSPGIYMVHVTSGTIVKTRKIVIE